MRRFLLVLTLALACSAAALADSDQDRARKAVQSGTVRPLGEILSEVRRTYPGRVLDAGIGEVGGRWFYDIRLLGTAGQVTELRVDAGSAEVLGVRGPPRPEPRAPEREPPPRASALPIMGLEPAEQRSERPDDADRGGRGSDKASAQEVQRIGGRN